MVGQEYYSTRQHIKQGELKTLIIWINPFGQARSWLDNSNIIHLKIQYQLSPWFTER